jgi:hypothetical protein
MKNYQRNLILGISALFMTVISAVTYTEVQAYSPTATIGTRTVVQLSGTKWATVDSTTFDTGFWVWANLANGGKVTDGQIPENADVLSVDVPVSNVTATDRTSSDEVFIGTYQNLPVSFSQSRNPVYLGSTYQYLIFLPSGALQQITADGIITKTEVSRAEKSGSAIIYTGNQDVSGVFAPTYMDNVLYNPADFNSRFGNVDKFSFVDLSDDRVITTMYSFSTLQGAETYATQNNAPLVSLDKLQEAAIDSFAFPTELKGLPVVIKGSTLPPCTGSNGLFYEDKNYKGAKLVVGIGTYKRLEGTWWDKRISSVISPYLGTATTLYERFGSNSPFVRFTNKCRGTSNLRVYYDFNDKTSIVSVY